MTWVRSIEICFCANDFKNTMKDEKKLLAILAKEIEKFMLSFHDDWTNLKFFMNFKMEISMHLYISQTNLAVILVLTSL